MQYSIQIPSTTFFACIMVPSAQELFAVEKMASQSMSNKKIAETLCVPLRTTQRWLHKLADCTVPLKDTAQNTSLTRIRYSDDILHRHRQYHRRKQHTRPLEMGSLYPDKGPWFLFTSQKPENGPLERIQFFFLFFERAADSRKHSVKFREPILGLFIWCFDIFVFSNFHVVHTNEGPKPRNRHFREPMFRNWAPEPPEIPISTKSGPTRGRFRDLEGVKRTRASWPLCRILTPNDSGDCPFRYLRIFFLMSCVEAPGIICQMDCTSGAAKLFFRQIRVRSTRPPNLLLNYWMDLDSRLQHTNWNLRTRELSF